MGEGKFVGTSAWVIQFLYRTPKTEREKTREQKQCVNSKKKKKSKSKLECQSEKKRRIKEQDRQLSVCAPDF